MDTEDELWARLDEAYRMQRGPARSAALEAVVARADVAGYDELSLEGRMELTGSYEHGGEPAKAFATFSSCLAIYRRTPERFVDGMDWRLRWQFKYMVSSMVKFPNVSLAQTHRMLDEMAAEYRVAGSTLHALYANQHLVARHVGDRDAAEDHFRRWTTTPRDRLSDCIGCDPESQVVWLAQTGRDAEAAALADDVLQGRFTCVEQPHSILTELLLPYVRLGRVGDAADAHRRGYRGIRHELTFLDKVGTHIEFCALTGNEARGLELLERHLPQLDRAPEPMAEMTFAAAGALLTRRLTDLGHGDLVVTVESADRPDEPTVRAWHDVLQRRALAVAERFDRRNGTTEQSERIRAVLAAEPLLDGLPLNTAPTARLPLATSPGKPATPATTTTPVDPPDLATLVARFRDARTLDEPEADAVAAALAARIDACGPDQVGHAFMARAMLADDRSDHVAAADDAERGRAAFEAAGDHVRAALATVRLAQHRLQAGDEPGEWVERTRAAWHSVAESDADPVLLAALRLRAFYVLANTGEQETAGALVDLGVSDPDDLGGSDVSVAALEFGAHAWWAMRHDDLAGTERFARAAADLHRRAGQPVRAARLTPMLARCAALTGRPADAVQAVDEALEVVSDPRLTAGLHELRGQALVDLGDLAAAADSMREAVTRYLLVGERVEAAYSSFTLGWCELRRGRPLDAAEVLEAALPGYELAGDPVPVARTRRLLVDALGRLGELDEVLRHTGAAAEAFTVAEQWGERAELESEAAEAVANQRPVDAARLHAAAVEAWDLAGDPVAAARAQRRHARWQIAVDPKSSHQAFDDARARLRALVGTSAADDVDLAWELADCDAEQSTALWWTDRNEEAAPYAEAAERAFVACGSPVPAARSAVLRARLVAERGEAEAARGHLERARALLPTDGDPRVVDQAARLARTIDALEATLVGTPDGS